MCKRRTKNENWDERAAKEQTHEVDSESENDWWIMFICCVLNSDETAYNEVSNMMFDKLSIKPKFNMYIMIYGYWYFQFNFVLAQDFQGFHILFDDIYTLLFEQLALFFRLVCACLWTVRVCKCERKKGRAHRKTVI